MSEPPEIQTTRLLLRPPTLADADDIFARYAQEPDVSRYLSWRPHRSIDDTVDFLRNQENAIQDGSLMSWLIRLRGSDRLLGSIGSGRNGHRRDLGYLLARDAWGHGFATEAVRAVTDVLLAESETWRIAALCDLENTVSARVLEKAGYLLEGTLRRYFLFPNLGDVPRDVLCYSRVR